MTVFNTSKHLCSRLALSLKTQIADKKETTHIGKSGSYFKPLLIQVALAASRKASWKLLEESSPPGETWLISHYLHCLEDITAIYHILRKGEVYDSSAYRKEENSPMVRQISQEKAFEMLNEDGVCYFWFLPHCIHNYLNFCIFGCLTGGQRCYTLF